METTFLPRNHIPFLALVYTFILLLVNVGATTAASTTKKRMDADIQIFSSRFYDLRQTINNGIGLLSKEEILQAKELVEKKIGKDLIEEKDARILLYDTQSPDKLIIIYVMFDENTKTDNRCIDQRFWIHNGKIVQMKEE